MKLPNGFGTVVKLSGNRRRPYVVKEGKSGQQKIIGYAATKEEGLEMLAKFSNDPWDIDGKKVTFSELFDLFLKKKTAKMSDSSVRYLKSAYKHCTKLDNTPYSNIKAYHMQDCIDSCNLSYASKNNIKNLFYHLDRFAMELDIINKQYSQLIRSESVPESKRTMFTDEEVNKLWQYRHLECADFALFLLYSGWRISEALDIKLEDIEREKGFIKGGTKTAAGKDRIVPIHSKIVPLVNNLADNSTSGYLFELNEKKISCEVARIKWRKLMSELEMNHTPHECRHTFRSRLDSAGANKAAIDLMMGHKSADVGERIYTHKSLEELKYNIELILN